MDLEAAWAACAPLLNLLIQSFSAFACKHTHRQRQRHTHRQRQRQRDRETERQRQRQTTTPPHNHALSNRHTVGGGRERVKDCACGAADET
eukprot:3490487-Rhodomonas_salina.1